MSNDKLVEQIASAIPDDYEIKVSPSNPNVVGPEVIIKPRRRISEYDTFVNNPATHLVRYGWNTAFNFKYPEDHGLGIETSIDRSKLPAQFQEIYFRFMKLGFIEQWGNHCILISCLLRRILRLHGFQATTKQVICYWANEEKEQSSKIGIVDQKGPGDPVENSSIDAHMVVMCRGYVLDFSLKGLKRDFGFIAPQALIGLDVESNEYQDFGISGQATWINVMPQNPIIKHWRLNQHQKEHELTNEYFKVFQF
jgi:hypothetical protein